MAASRPEIFTLRHRLPDGDGKDLMRQLARRIPGMPFGFWVRERPGGIPAAGFSESLVKPVDIGELINAIGRVIGAA